MASSCKTSSASTRRRRPTALYDIFVNDLATDPSQGQPPHCAWNTDYHQAYPWYDASDPLLEERPVSVVDWCDALAFCKYWGKHLCGARGDGGALAMDAQAKFSQWYTACTNGTSQAYPYGNVYNASACNTGAANSGAGIADPVGKPSTCQGGVPGLFDMSGNDQEWENACDDNAPDPSDDSCQLRGGTYFFPIGLGHVRRDGGGQRQPAQRREPVEHDPMLLGALTRCCWDLPSRDGSCLHAERESRGKSARPCGARLAMSST